MDACKSTTPVRRYLSSFAVHALADIEKEDDAAPLFVKAGSQFDPASDALVVKHAQRVVAAHFRPGALVLQRVDRLREFVTLQLGSRDHEVFALVLLDRRFRLIDYVELFHGTVDGVTVYPRHVLECALECRAEAVILIHFVARHKMDLMCPGLFCGVSVDQYWFPAEFDRAKAHNELHPRRRRRSSRDSWVVVRKGCAGLGRR